MEIEWNKRCIDGCTASEQILWATHTRTANALGQKPWDGLKEVRISTFFYLFQYTHTTGITSRFFFSRWKVRATQWIRKKKKCLYKFIWLFKKYTYIIQSRKNKNQTTITTRAQAWCIHSTAKYLLSDFYYWQRDPC